MDFSFGLTAASPWLLLLLILLPLFIWYQYRYTSRITGTRKTIAIALRSLIVLLIICLVAGVQPYSSTKQRNVAIVVDRSDSIGSDNGALAFLQNIKTNDERNHLAIISFGENVLIDRSLQPLAGQSAWNAFRTVVQEGGSSIAAALRQAGSMLNQYRGGKIVLLTDGVETSGDFLKEAQLLKAMDVTVDVVQLPHKINKDAAISALKVPSQLKQGEKYQLAITIDSTHQAGAELLIYEDDALIAQQTVELVQGENSYLVDAVATSSGMKQYRAVIRMEGDTESRNNSNYSFSRVAGPAGVLIVEGEPGSSRNIEAALSSSFIAYRTISPIELSYELASYIQYDAIIFNNVSAVDLPQIKMEHIAAAVRQYGVGFVMLGGNDSYGPGGYFDTPIETILPLNMQLSGKKRIPDLQLMLVIDQSGSMYGEKMELAKEAAARTVELLRSVDTVGVIAFDTVPNWVVSPVKLDDKESVISSIMSIQPDGGTDIYPALSAAYNGFDLQTDARKHIILLSDGMSANTPQYQELLRNLNENNITLSTVAVGQDADIRFLQQLAADGNGRSYYTDDASTIPAIFSREATLMSRAYIVEGEITPVEGYAGSWSQLWRDGLPKLDAYVATSAKSTAEIALWSPQEDPLLARWNIGAGKSVAFTSDVNGKWSANWVSWPKFSQVFTEWVRWTYPQFVQTPYTVEANEQGKLLITSHDQSSQANLGMTIEHEGESSILPLVPVAPGQYEVDISDLESGVYFTQIGEQQGTDTVNNGITTGFVIPYSAEYRLDADLEQAADRLKTLAEMTGGQLLSLDNTSSIFSFEPVELRMKDDWTKYILLLILLLWLIDIGNRRLSLPWRTWFAKFSSIASRMFQRSLTNSGESSVTTSQRSLSSSESLQRLKQRKQSVAERTKFMPLEMDAETENSALIFKQANRTAEGKASTESAKHEKQEAERSAYATNLANGAKDKTVHAKHSANSSMPHDQQNGESFSAPKDSKAETMNRLLAAKNRRKK